MKIRTVKDYFIITLKGIAMGAADVVPGVSGGTIAFISGIYEELLETINAFNFGLIKVFKSGGIKKVWKAINGNFLISLLSGIFLSIISLAKSISWLLENKPILVWSFFFGLVLASIFFVGKQIAQWNYKIFIGLIIGAIFAYFITILRPMVTESSSSLFYFFAGSLAIIAMILPGISGSFILVLLGAYKPILQAIHEKNLQLLLIVAAGAVVGLLSFSRILKWLFNHYKNLTLAVLTGFLIGSLNKIWPWKEVLETKEINGKLIVLNEQSISPYNYAGDNQLFYALALALFGFLLILILEKMAANKSVY
ncbi:MAG: DUF368 domain-containing protein [Flavobacteriaceae bacterium]|nr:DUF368 domain-containing protein [Flavobacteriaceae bacterium]